MKKLLLLNGNDEIIIEYNINELPLKEEAILEKSMELFSDPEPCIIHKTFVMKKLILEIDEYLENNFQKVNGIFKVDKNLPFDYLEIPQTISSILVQMN